MAEKRMFTNKIVSSDPFKEMPLSTQALYFHLGMNADDEGFLNNAKSVQRSILASDDDMKILIAKNFVIPFESGIVVIKHWKMNNQIQPSKLRPTQYTEERKLLGIKENKSYTLLPTDCRRIADELPPSVDKCSVDKNSIGECSVVECNTEKQPTPTPTQSITYESLVHKYGKAFVDERITRAKRYSNTNIETVAKWCEEDYEKKKKSASNFPQRTYDMEALEKSLIDTNRNDDDP